MLNAHKGMMARQLTAGRYAVKTIDESKITSTRQNRETGDALCKYLGADL